MTRKTALSDAILEFLESHPGETFTAAELWERLSWPGRVLPCHVRQALERRLFPLGLVAANRRMHLVDGFFKAFPLARWCASEKAPQEFWMYDLLDGVCRVENRLE